jgi:hypothetical protein
MISKIVTALLLCLPASVSATWHQATTAHYILYSQEPDPELKAAAERLEKFDFLLRTVFKVPTRADEIKVQVYMLPTMDAVARSMPFAENGVAGYYQATVRAPFAVALDEIGGDSYLPAQQVLFHELTHHFMFQNFPGVYPTWYVEGFADFMGAARINKNDSFTLGLPIDDRYAAMYYARDHWIPVGKLLSAQNYGDVDDSLLLLYSQGWALVDYLWFDKAREGQLQTYLHAIRDGKSYKDAASAAFGSFTKLNGDLWSFTQLRTLPTMTMAFKRMDIGPIDIRPVSPAQNALMMDDLSLNSGVAASAQDEFLKRVHRDAAPYARDPFALRIVAEADRLCGASDDEAKTVATWLKVAPNDPLALLHNGLVGMDALKVAKNADPAAWNAARANLVAALRIEQHNPQVLKGYYDSYLRQGITPTPGAQNGLYMALDLVPQEDDIRYELAHDFEMRGMTAEAIEVIRPAALQMASRSDLSPSQRARRDKQRAKYRLAGEVDHETAREMYDRLVAKTSGAAKP